MLRALPLLLLSTTLACSDASEGEGEPNEGEGDTSEGEGDIGEGEGDIGEGEGDTGEGEGEGDIGEGEGEGEGVPLDCTAIVAAPASFERIAGFTSSEDFAFDAQGNYVGVDELGNVVRVSIDGTTELWYPNIGGTAGMAILPDGSLVIADVGRGAVVRLSEDGNLSLVLGGLAYPNGLDIGPDGFIYVAENFAGRVRRIDPDTGDFTIVALGLTGPNGVAFSNDPQVLYVGSFEGSGVYRVDIPSPGELGTARVFARPHNSSLPEPIIACPEGSLGESCFTTTGSAPGVCATLANTIDCVAVDPCAGLQPGDSCDTGFGDSGICVVDDLGTLVCGFPAPCDGLNVGDACTDFGTSGVCSSDGGGGLYCNSDPCSVLADGDPCVLDGGSGVCVITPDYSYCDTQPCVGADDGDACDLFGEPGVCVNEFGVLECDTRACLSSAPGSPCEENGLEGVCVIELGQIFCNTDVCLSQELGSLCTSFNEAGTCTATGNGTSYCETNPCRFSADGAACELGGTAGICTSDGCDTNPCTPASVGNTCVDVRGPGTCVDSIVAGRPVCAPDNPCTAAGDACLFDGGTGSCEAGPQGLYCARGCSEDNLFEGCATVTGNGTCFDDGVGQVFCVTVDCLGTACTDSGGTCAFAAADFTCSVPIAAAAACAGASEGQLCSLAGNDGVCSAGFCGSVGADDCQGRDEGEACSLSGGQSGICETTSGYLLCGFDSQTCAGQALGSFCPAGSLGGLCASSNEGGAAICFDLAGMLAPPCDGAQDGDNCEVGTDAGTAFGICIDGFCNVDLGYLGCVGLNDGDSCDVALVGAAIPGVCIDGGCQLGGVDESPGGIDGLGVDACGNVYASEFTNGSLWRITPTGDITELAKLPSSWIPNIKWGRGVGGFSRTIMYVADRDQASLFAVEVGVPGATEFYDLGQP